MQIILNTRRTEYTGPSVEIHCPRCKKRNATASTTAVLEQNRLFYFIPFFNAEFTRVQCDACKSKLRLIERVDNVAALDIDERSRRLASSTSLPAMVSAVLSIVLSVLPIVGVVMALVALALNLKSGTFWRNLSIVGLILSIAIPAAILGIALFAND